MELAGLEPAASWVRSSRPLTSKVPRLQRFMGERLERRNISRNSLHRVLQRHEILDRLPAPSKRSAGEHLHGKGRVDPTSLLLKRGSPSLLRKEAPSPDEREGPRDLAERLCQTRCARSRASG